MPELLNFTGFIRGVKYKVRLAQELERIEFENFDVNTSNSFGMISMADTEIAYSKWVSPKRTRSYPFARIYNTYNAAKVLTVIPIIKDEGKDGDLDKIQYSTFSWMNLLNIYIVLGYYEDAEKSTNPKQVNKHKLTNQRFNNQFIKSQIQEIFAYKQSALHWNRNLLEDRFLEIFRQSLNSYQDISNRTNAQIHSQDSMNSYLEMIKENFENFKNLSLKSSEAASNREVKTTHSSEYLTDGTKATLSIENYLGGTYYLTIDEIIKDQDVYIIQESKNSTKKALPELSDIQDGLFKLILYSNIDSLFLNNQQVEFTTRLKLTGQNIKGSITLPCGLIELRNFFVENVCILSEKEMNTIRRLLSESTSNENITIVIGGNN
ncbi:hypothetical protein Syn7502_02119 [Synechococcus sp. PCC 7502]|uniref:hypothetical protein n=1 Tax=Synechococcus sp. PCC 7502 TaxID=1173263 RepID=UPI00029F9394|nr:hypothetical protein [Synechococcus sp. PCC 7502]AFY74134.1 hypothetical protein Syn7502_02119 [Synechococcus sp. PCC 7502]